jgi:hypothetical protein
MCAFTLLAAKVGVPTMSQRMPIAVGAGRAHWDDTARVTAFSMVGRWLLDGTPRWKVECSKGKGASCAVKAEEGGPAQETVLSNMLQAHPRRGARISLGRRLMCMGINVTGDGFSIFQKNAALDAPSRARHGMC